MRELAGGEIGALGELYDRYHERVRRFVARATSDAYDVDDLVHATFLAAAKSAGRYDGRPSCRPWLIGIAAQLLRRRRQSFGRFLTVLSSLRAIRATALAPPPASDPSVDFRAAMAALDVGDNHQAAAAFVNFLEKHPRDARAEDAAYLRVIAFQRSGDSAGTKQAALEYLRRYPAGFRQAEVEPLSR
jgi:RNA polymerase sigma factor (sigma-70 family)